MARSVARRDTPPPATDRARTSSQFSIPTPIPCSRPPAGPDPPDSLLTGTAAASARLGEPSLAPAPAPVKHQTEVWRTLSCRACCGKRAVGALPTVAQAATITRAADDGLNAAPARRDEKRR